MSRGRPRIYEDNVKPKIKFIKSLIKDGFSQEDIIEFLGISRDTFFTYKKEYKEFSDTFEKEDVIQQVEETYINRLLGRYKATKEVYERVFNDQTQQYEMVLTKTERYEVPFNDGAYARYLAIMKPEKWSLTAGDQQTLDEIKKGITLNFVNGSGNDKP